MLFMLILLFEILFCNYDWNFLANLIRPMCANPFLSKNTKTFLSLLRFMGIFLAKFTMCAAVLVCYGIRVSQAQFVLEVQYI